MIKKDILNQDEESIQALYSKLDKKEPSTELDSSILDAAHHEVDGKKNIIEIMTRKRSWYVPISSVAILVISLSVVINIALGPDLLLEKQEVSNGDYEPIDAIDTKAELQEPTDHLIEKDEDLLLDKQSIRPRLMGEEQSRRVSVSADEDEFQRKQQLTEEYKVRKKQKAKAASKMKSEPAGYMIEGDQPQTSSMSLNKKEPEADVVTDSLKSDISVDEWVQQLQKLYKQGQKVKFEQLLKEFRLIYPEHTLPEELAKWENQGKK